MLMYLIQAIQYGSTHLGCPMKTIHRIGLGKENIEPYETESKCMHTIKKKNGCWCEPVVLIVNLRIVQRLQR